MNKQEADVMLQEGYNGMLFGTRTLNANRVAVGVPMTGTIRSEWHHSRVGQVIPCNWSQTHIIQWLTDWSPIGHQVADARNIIATQVVEGNYEWLYFIDHDVICPPDTIIRWNERMLTEKIPVWSGLYFTKSVPSEPLLYRGRGNSHFTDWKLGDEVWVDGIPMGCTVIHNSILRVLYERSEEYQIMGMKVRKIFETPARVAHDPETNSWFNQVGTEDLEWCNRVIDTGVFEAAGWPEYADKEFPFLLDTAVFCRHIDWNGIQYPSLGEERFFEKGMKDETL